ncbi:excise: excisionase-type transcriptional regulator [Gaiella occulta]|uniref:Excise: excisionase-type transcriptional regulator n=1 Tax=Gaiella occulta TaxID=1002870 RepID=A0A7M2YZI9_9ACTN|nr:excise: excisionase-type transcriptional regulator [Gaiella occulta]
MNEPMLTVRQVAELLRVHENWVYDQAAAGKLPSYKIGGTRRFRPDEVDGWIAQHRDASAPRVVVHRPRPVKHRSARPTRAAQPRLFEDGPAAA